MKKWKSRIMTLGIVFVLSSSLYALPSSAASTKIAQQTQVIFNGELIEFEPTPFIQRGVTMAPAKTLLELLGYKVYWDEQKEQLLAYKQGRELILQVGQQQATVNGVGTQLPSPAVIVQNQLFIPLRFIAELDKAVVKWDSRNRAVTIEHIEPIKISITLPFQQTDGEQELQEQFEKFTGQFEQDHNVNIDLIFVPNTNYQDKLNLMIAAGERIDLAYMPNPYIYQPQLFQAITKNLESELSKYPMLSKLPEQSIEQLKRAFNGVYGVPKLASNVDGIFPVLNQAWLDALGLAQPTTMDELYIVLQQFAQYAPDAINKKDTYGLTGYIGTEDLGSLAWVEHVFNETPSRYERQGDKIVDLALQKGTRDALSWLQKAYAEGLLDPSFTTHSKDEALNVYKEGKAGVAAMTFADAARLTTFDLKVSPLVALQHSATAKKVTATSLPYNGIYYISRNSNETNTAASLEVLDALYALANDSNADVKQRAVAKELVGSPTIELTEADNQTKASFASIEKARSEIATKPLLEAELHYKLTREQLEQKTILDEQMTEVKIKVIKGEYTLNDWDNFIAKLATDSDYIAIMEAFNRK